MDKQIRVNLGFTADTSQAKANIEALRTSLNQLSSITPFSGGQLTQGLQSAVSSAKELQRHLSTAFNTKTGNLDLSKLDLSLKSANTSLSTLGTNLLKAGSQGQQAFMNLQNAISTANIQVKTANGLLARFGTTMMNTIKWQLSSSLIHGFMGSMRKAVNYVEDLNKSLNNIRIVTQYDTDRMADFAREANKAAKALSASTTAYTDASLIYFQQGLNEKQAKERADITIKMSNVTRQSVEETSSQMTAIWNNFAKEGENLERFGDILAALGAKTASSTAEIAGGIEKFAGLANTIGLSYEYAASALATIVAETRQSEDVVGTALKTIFARLQGLQLGETLEDGVSLNKYSEALHKVGVEVLDASGEMRSMDNILQDLSVKWKGLSNAQQTALAQTVAGVRQYTQLVTLMDNYDVMESNLNIARTADGTLEAQSEVYEQSIEAAGKRLKASAQDIYSALLPEDAIYGFTEGLSKAVDLIADLLKGMGGLPGILLMVSNIALTKMRPALTDSINESILKVQQFGINFKNSITNAWNSVKSTKQMLFSGDQSFKQVANTAVSTMAQNSYHAQGQKLLTTNQTIQNTTGFEKQRDIASSGIIGQDAVSNATKLSNELLKSEMSAGKLPGYFEAYLFNIQKINNVQSLINESAQYLSKADQQRLSTLQAEAMAASDQEVKERQILETLEAQQRTRIENTRELNNSKLFTTNTSAGNDSGGMALFNGILANTAEAQNVSTMLNQFGAGDKFSFGVTSSDFNNQAGLMHLGDSKNEMAEYANLCQQAKQHLDAMYQVNEQIYSIEQQTTSEEEKQEAIIKAVLNSQGMNKNIQQDLVNKMQGKSSQNMSKIFKNEGIRAAEDFAQATGVSEKSIKGIAEGATEVGSAMKNVNASAINTKNKFEEISRTITDAIARTSSWGGVISGFAQGLSTVAMGVNSISNAFNALGNEEASVSQKLMASTMALTMGIKAISTVLKGAGLAYDSFNAKKQASIITTNLEILSQKKYTQERDGRRKIEDFNTLKDLAKQKALQASRQLQLSTEQKEIIQKAILNEMKKKGRDLTGQETDAIIAEILAREGETAASKASLAVKMGHLAIILAIAAALTLMVVAIVRASQAEEREAKQAAETAKRLAERAQEAKDKVESIADAFENYSKVIDTLNSCAKGTEAWNEALEEAHNQVDSLLEQFPELLKYANLLNDDGTINQEALEQFQAEQQEIASNATAASLMSKHVQKQEELDVEYQEVAKNSDLNARIFEHNGEKYYINQTNNQIYTLDEDGEKGKLVTSKSSRGATGYFNNNNQLLFTGDDVWEDTLNNKIDLSKTREYVSKALENGVSNLAEVAQMFPNATKEYCEVLLEMIKSEQEGINIFENVKEQMTKEWEQLNNINLTEQQEELMAAEYAKMSTQIYNDFKSYDAFKREKGFELHKLEKILGESQLENSEYKGKTMLEAYEMIIGEDIDWKTNVDKGGKSGKLRYKDENGDNKTLDKEDVYQVVASALALENLGLENIGETSKTLAEFSDTIGSSGVLDSFIGGKQGSFENLTAEQLAGFEEKFDTFVKGWNNTQKADFAASMGFSSWDDFYNKVFAAKDAAQNSMVINITNNNDGSKSVKVNRDKEFSGNNEGYIEKVFTNWLTANPNFSPTGEFQNAIADSLEQAFSLGGDTLASSLESALSNLDLSALNPEQLEEFMNLLSGFDWSQNGAVEQFLNQLGGISPALSGNLDLWSQFAEQAEQLGLNLPIDDMETFISQMGTLLGMLQDFEIGKVLKPEEFNKFLGAMGEEAYDYVSQDIDGNYVVTKEMSQDKVTEYYANRFNQQKGVYDYLTEGRDVEEVAADATSYLTMANNTEMTKNDNNYNSMMEILREILLDKNLTSEDFLSIFGESKEKVGEILASGTLEQQQDLFRSYADMLQTGASGGYDDEAYQNMIMRAAQDATTLSQTEGYYNADGTISEEGAKQMARIAAETEGAEDILDRYNEAVEEAAGDTEKLDAANKDLDKSMKQLYSNKTAKNIRDVVKELDKLTGEERNVKLKEIADELNTAFGTETFNSKLVDQNMPLIKRWLNGDVTATEKLIEISIVADPETQEYLNAIDDEKTRETHKEIIIDAVSKGADLNQVIEQLNAIPSNLNVDIATAYQNGGTQGLLKELVQAYILAGDVAKATSLITGFSCNVEGLEKYIEEVNKLNGFTEEEKYTPEYMHQLAKVGYAWKNVTFSTSNENNNDSPPSPELPAEEGGGSSESARDKIKDGYQKAIDRQKKDLERIREGLNPVDAQKYYQMEIDLIEKENELLEEQIGLRKDALKKAVDDFNMKDLGYKLEISDDGTISNMADVMAEISLKYDEMASRDGEVRAEKEFNALLEELSSVQTIEDRVWEVMEQLKENEKHQAELELEKITSAIDWKVQLIDWEIEKLNYYQEKLMSQAHGNKQEIEALLDGFQYQQEEMQQLIKKSSVLKEGISALQVGRANHEGYEQMYNEAILDYQQQLLDVSKDIIDLRNEIEDLVQNVLDKALDETSTQLERISTYSSMLGGLTNIIDLSGRSILDAGLKYKISSMNIQTLTEKMKGLKEEMTGLTEATELAKKAYENSLAANDEQSIKFWENQLSILEQELESSQSEFLSSWEEVLNSASDIFEAQVQTISLILSDALSPYSSLEALQTAYDQVKTIQEQYLDDSTKLYELNKLNRQLNLAITDENDLLAKQKLRDIQEDIYNLQRTGVQMSQYDLDILQKKYDLRLAEIALMESQNSKTSMRLVRDASGSYSYVYDADEEKIEDATQKYEDALYELDQVSKEYLTEITDTLLSNDQEFTEAIMNLDKTSADYEKQLLELQSHYNERSKYLLNELQKGAENSGIAFSETLYAQMKDIESYEEAYELFVNNSDKAVADLITSYQDWKDVVNQTMDIAGTSWDNFSQDMDSTLTSLESHIESLCNKIGELITVLMNYLKKSITMVGDWQSAYSLIVQGVLSDNEMVFNSHLVSDDYIYAPVEDSGGFGGSGLLGMLFGGNDYVVPVDKEKYAKAYNAKNGWCARWVADVREAVGDDVQRAASASEMAKTGQAYKYGGQELAPGTVVLAYDEDGFGHAMIVGLNGKIYGTANTASDLAITSLSDYPWGSLYYIPPSDKQKGDKAGLLAQSIYAQREKDARKAASAFDTGGYTGNWNSSEGRLAVLHEKEIVLNKQDTPNLLQAISILRDMNLSNLIDESIVSMLNQTSANLANLMNQVSLKDYSYPDQTIEQTVQINAEFPNATDQYEIQEALANLSNNASQYLGLHK